MLIRGCRLPGAVLAVAALFAMTACSAGSPGQSSGDSAGGGEIRIAVGGEPGTIDPAQQNSVLGGNIVLQVAETLTTSLTEDGQVEPLLATEWEVSEDGLSYVFKLREGITFSDGTDFDAEAVKFNIDRLRDESVKVPYRSGFANITDVTVVDPLTVQFTLAEAASTFPGWLSRYSAGILSPASFETEGNSYENVVHPVGTGPYLFEKYQKGAEVSFVRNDAYWGDAATFGAMTWLVVPEPAAREAIVQSGGAEIALAPPPSGIEALRASDRVEVLETVGINNVFFGINVVGDDQPLLKDVRVREALNYAIDRPAIIKNVLFGLADEVNSPVAMALNNACETGSFEYDPERAKKLLAEAGAENLSVKMITSNGRYIQDSQAASAVAGYLDKVGVTVEGPTTQDWSSYIQTILGDAATAPFDLGLLGNAPSSMDAAEVLSQRTSAQVAPNGLNFQGWVDSEYDAEVAAGLATVDPAAAADHFCNAQKIEWATAPSLQLWTERAVAISSTKVSGVKILPNGMIFLEEASF